MAFRNTIFYTYRSHMQLIKVIANIYNFIWPVLCRSCDIVLEYNEFCQQLQRKYINVHVLKIQPKSILKIQRNVDIC